MGMVLAPMAKQRREKKANETVRSVNDVICDIDEFHLLRGYWEALLPIL